MTTTPDLPEHPEQRAMAEAGSSGEAVAAASAGAESSAAASSSAGSPLGESPSAESPSAASPSAESHVSDSKAADSHATPAAADEPAADEPLATEAAASELVAGDPAAAPVAKPREMTTAETAQELRKRFPGLFGHGAKPLKLRIQADIQVRAPGVFTKQALSAFLRRHTGSTSYLMALSKARERFDLDGAPAAELAAEHRDAAIAELARRRESQVSRQELERQQRFNRAGLLRDFQNTTLTAPNFCALKGVAVEELDGLLELARREAEEDRAQRAAMPMGQRPASRPDQRPEHRADQRPDQRPSGRGDRRPPQRPPAARRDGPKPR